MKLFWRPSHVSPALLVLVALLSVGGYVVVERYRVVETLPYKKNKAKASRLAQKAYAAIKQERLARGIHIESDELDPAASGIIGVTVSAITSKAGNLEAKQTTVNPNWAAVFYSLFKKAHLRRGDTVALGISGSFPALNIAALAACEVMGLKPVVISSVSASMWGANHPKFTWLDMETVLRKDNLINVKSVAASYGGVQDRGIGIPREGLKLIHEAIQRNGIVEINDPDNKEEDLEGLIDRRIQLYEEAAEDEPIRAYVNIGGGIASVGSLRSKHRLRPGLNDRVIPGVGVIHHFLRKGVPVIHIVKIRELANRYSLPWIPQITPKPGHGEVYVQETYAMWLAWSVLIGILLALVAITRFDFAFLRRRVFRPTSKDTKQQPGV